MSFDPEQPYNDLPALPPEGDLWESLEVYQKLAEANKALGELKGRTPVIPNPQMLINTLVLQEAKDSSSIENIFTTSDKLYKAFTASSLQPDNQTKEVLSYRHALWNGWNEVQQNGIGISLLENIYRTVKEAKDGIRDQGVYIGDRSKRIYTPPCCKDVLEKKLNQWIEFATGSTDIDPVIKMAMLHFQFEAIHPFKDGNGRAGRIMNVLFLSHTGIIDEPILYLSKYINEHKSDYYRLLREVTEDGNWQEWILYMLTAITDTARFTLKKVNAIYQLFQDVIEQIRKEAPTIYSYELVELLFCQPYCKIKFLVDNGIASRNTAGKYLNRLEELGLLVKEQMGNESLYLNKPLYDLLLSDSVE